MSPILSEGRAGPRDPYGLDLRTKILDAYERGEGSVRTSRGGLASPPTPCRTIAGAHGRLAVSSLPLMPVGFHHASTTLTWRTCARSLREAGRDGGRVGEAVPAAHAHPGQPFDDGAGAPGARSHTKETLHADEGGTERVVAARAAFALRLRRIRLDALVILDELGLNLGRMRSYARAPRGERAHGSMPNDLRPTVTLTIGLGLEGIVAPFLHRGATTAPPPGP